MRKAKMQSEVLLAGVLLSIPWNIAVDAEATTSQSSQSHLVNESRPASQPAKLKDAAISPLAKRVVDMLAAASMKLAQGREKAQKLQPKIEAAIEKAKNSKYGQKITELARTARAKAQELASQAKKTARVAGTQLEKAAEQTADKAEGMDTVVSSAKKDANKIKLQTPTSQPTEAYYRALWHYRVLWAKQALLKARAVCEQTIATALKGANATGNTGGINRRQRASPRKEVHDIK